MRVVYEGPHDAVEVPDLAPFVGVDEFPDLDVVVARGVPTDVPDEVAGRPPKGAPGDEKYDPGEGLLAQDTWSAGPPDKPARAGKDEPARPVKDGER